MTTPRMPLFTPIRTGIALAITVALCYALCTLIWVIAPGQYLSLMNNLFHGMDFTGMTQLQPFSWLGFLVALLVLSIWGFFAGAFFAWLHDRLAR